MNGNTSGIVCTSCTPEYCGCADFYRGRMSFWRGELDEVWIKASRRRIVRALALRTATDITPAATSTRG